MNAGMRPLALKSVLVAIDPEHPAASVAHAAAELARVADAPLHVVAVAMSGESAELSRVHDDLSRLLQQAGTRPDATTIHALDGDPARAIGRIADRTRASVMVLGPHRGGIESTRALGGTALAVVTNAACPCLVVRRPLRLPLREVVVPIDVSDTARGALLVGLSWASALRLNTRVGEHSGTTLTALHVTASENRGAAPQAIERAIADVRDAAGTWAGVSIRSEAVADKDVTHGIAVYVATHAPDLVAIGTRGLGTDSLGRLGSIAAAVTARIETPVLLVPPAMWMAYSQAREA